MRESTRIALALTAALTMAAAAVAAPPFDTYRQVPTEPAVGGFEKTVAAERQAEIHAWLISERAPIGKSNAFTMDFPADKMAALPDLDSRRFAVGVSETTNVSMNLGQGLGTKRTADGGAVWTTTVRVPGATALRLYFEGLNLPAKTELYLYNDHGQVRGPYTGMGPGAQKRDTGGSFWSHTIDGDTVYVQARSFGVPGKGAFGPTLRIAEIGIMGDRFLKGRMGTTTDFSKSFCSFNESCVENASCSSIPSAVSAMQDSHAHYVFRSGRSFFICTGGLIADSDTGSQIPYFLTANHCMSKGREAASIEAFFQFSTNCNGACFDPDGVTPSVLGSSLEATSSSTDFTLLRLDQPAPTGSAFLGWTTTPVAFSNGTNLFRISHPKGAPQAYSEHSVDSNAGTCNTLPRGNFIYSRDTYGATEGGSSGSPVVNSSGQIVGQLFGACGTNVNDTCDVASNATVDGAFAETYASVAQFLDGGGSCTDNDNDGFCANDDCDDNNAAVNPGAAEVCGDMLDNNCNSTIDEGCGVCTPIGASCSTNGDCCSNKCRGPRGNKTCR